MAQIDEIKAKIKALRAETEANSITPDSLGLILDDMASLIGSQNSGPIGVASPYIDITLKIEQGNLVLYPVEYLPTGADASTFEIRLMRHVSTRDRNFDKKGYRKVAGWRIPQNVNNPESRFQFYRWPYTPGAATIISNTPDEIGGQVVEDKFPRVIVHYGRYKQEFIFTETPHGKSREQIVIRQFGLAVFDGRTRISNIARFSLRVVGNEIPNGVDFSFTFEKGEMLKEKI